MKHKLADINIAVTQLDAREREVLQQGQQLKEQINTHAQQIIDRVQRSQTHLSQQVDTIVQRNTQALTAQRQQAQKLRTQLETCQKMIENSFKEWNQLQILTEKQKMMQEMKTATQHVDPAVFQPGENANIQFKKTDIIEKEIGLITTPPSAKRPSPATHTLQPHGGSSATKQDQVTTGKVKRGATTSFTIPVMPSSQRSGKPVSAITRLSGPKGIAVRDNGDIIVVESYAHCITILDKEGRAKSFGTKGPNDGQFINPHGVAITKDGCILVTDNHRLQKLTTQGVCIKSIGALSGRSQLRFSYPAGIAVHPTTGQIFVADSSNKRIQVFTDDLTFVRTIHNHHEPLNDPCDVALDNEGYLYVAEAGGDCITKFTTTGQYVARFGSRGSAPGQLRRPSALAIDNNLVYVGHSSYNHYVSVFDTTGKFLYCFSEMEGERYSYAPKGIALDVSTHKLYCSDTSNEKVVLYQL